MIFTFIDKVDEFKSGLGVYIDLALGILLAIILCCVAVKVSHRKVYIGVVLTTFALIFVSVFFKFYITAIAIGLVMILFFTWFAYNYSSNLKKIFKKMHKAKKINQLGGEEKEKLLDTIESAVLDLSTTKTGAIITFETSESLVELCNNGVTVEAPVTAELLKTIFYVGTPLHDGACIIRGNNIEAAAVFYTPSIKAMKGKYGARHRAAIGFSEQHEAVTVVVSEETGKISFAISGDLIPVSHDTFRKRLEAYLDF